MRDLTARVCTMDRFLFLGHRASCAEVARQIRILEPKLPRITITMKCLGGTSSAMTPCLQSLPCWRKTLFFQKARSVQVQCLHFVAVLQTCMSPSAFFHSAFVGSSLPTNCVFATVIHKRICITEENQLCIRKLRCNCRRILYLALRS